MPISYADAITILTALNNHGPSISNLNSRWRGGGLAIRGVHYNVGPSPAISLHLRTEAILHTGQVHNEIGKIPGTSDETIVLGNHRHAWRPMQVALIVD